MCPPQQPASSRRATLRTAAADQEAARRGLCPSASSAVAISGSSCSRPSTRPAPERDRPPARIHLAHLTDADDLERMLDAVTEARRLALSEPVAAITAGTELSPGPAFPTDNRDGLAAWVRTAVSTYHHPRRHLRHGPRSRSGCRHRLARLGAWDRGSHDRRCLDHADHPDRDHVPPDDHGGRAHRAVAPKHVIRRLKAEGYSLRAIAQRLERSP